MQTTRAVRTAPPYDDREECITMEGKLHINTTAVHGGGRKDDCFGAINEPIYMTSNYRIPTDGTPVDWSGIHSNIYQRNRNPNQMAWRRWPPCLPPR